METGIIKNWTKGNLSWLAGFLEGEGSFTSGKAHTRKNPQLRVTACSTDKDTLEKCQNISGMGLSLHKGKKKTLYRKDFWCWYVSKQEYAYALAVALYSFMGSRRKEQIRQLLIVFKQLPSPSPLYIALGETKTLSEWHRDNRCKVCVSTILIRLHQGWSFENAISTPPLTRSEYGKKGAVAVWKRCKEVGVNHPKKLIKEDLWPNI